MGNNMKKQSLKIKLTLSYLLVALLLVAAVSLFSNVFMQKQFEEYIMREQNRKNQEAVTMISRLYDGTKGGYDAEALDNAGMTALENGLMLKVTDASGMVIWDAMVHNHGFCVQMLQSMADTMQRRYRNFEGAYEEKTYQLPDENAGTVTVGYYGPFYFSENDALYLDTLNRVLAIIGILSLVFAVILGFYMARRISRPLSQAVDATMKIADGDYTASISDKGSTLEIAHLTDAVNSLAHKLAEQDTLRKRLTADVAHELRTPLASLQGHIEAFIDNVWSPDHEHLSSCHQEILRVNRLVDSLERLANLENGSALLDKTTFGLKSLAESIVLGFKAACHNKQLSIHVLGDDVQINADRDKIGQVISNLLSNSIRHTPHGGHITITISQSGDTVRMLFEDDGAGIEQEHLPHIFERFYRADSSRSKRSGGGGIGLAIVRAILDMHGGKITAHSTLGMGTQFVIELPSKKFGNDHPK